MEITLAAVFISVALVAGLALSSVLSSTSAERRRLRAVTRPADAIPLPDTLPLSTDQRRDVWQSVAPLLGLSQKEFTRLRQRLMRAGFKRPSAPLVYSVLERIAPILAGAVPLFVWSPPAAYFGAAIAAGALVFAPGLVVDHALAG